MHSGRPDEIRLDYSPLEGAPGLEWSVRASMDPTAARFGATLAEACARALVALGRCA
jgi:hypothetical protein